MRQALGWMVVALCCVVGAASGEERLDVRLQEARRAWEEARKLSQAGKHADAIERDQHALTLQEAVVLAPAAALLGPCAPALSLLLASLPPICPVSRVGRATP